MKNFKEYLAEAPTLNQKNILDVIKKATLPVFPNAKIRKGPPIKAAKFFYDGNVKATMIGFEVQLEPDLAIWILYTQEKVTGISGKDGDVKLAHPQGWLKGKFFEIIHYTAPYTSPKDIEIRINKIMQDLEKQKDVLRKYQ